MQSKKSLLLNDARNTCGNTGTDINACPIARGKCEREKNDFGQVNGRLEKPERSS